MTEPQMGIQTYKSITFVTKKMYGELGRERLEEIYKDNITQMARHEGGTPIEPPGFTWTEIMPHDILLYPNFSANGMKPGDWVVKGRVRCMVAARLDAEDWWL